MADAAPDLEARRWLRLVSTTRRTVVDNAAQVSSAIAAAYAQATPIQAVIGRPNLRTGQCHWLYGDLYPPATADEPAGEQSERTPIDAAQVSRVVTAVPHWRRGGWELSPRSDPLPETGDLGTEDVVFSTDGAPLVWVVTARPVTPDEVATRREAVTAEIARGHAQGPQGRLTAERLERLVELLDVRAGYGLWSVTVAVGSSSVAASAGALYALARMTSLASAPVRPGRAGSWLGLDELAAFLAPPRREVPGIRVIERAEWDQVPEQLGSGSRAVRLGSVLGEDGRHTAQPLRVSDTTVNRHVFVSGATGSGKSETVRTLLTGLAAEGIPWLVIEPVKAEYHRLAGRVHGSELLVLRPGDPRFPAVGLNPLEPSAVTVGQEVRRAGLQTHVDLLRTLFDAAFSAEEPFPQILSAALERSYRSLGWDLALDDHLGDGEPPPFPTLLDLRRHALQAVETAGYGSEVRDNIRGFIEVRLGSLEHGAPGRFFTTAHHIDLQRVASRHVVLQIEDIGNDRDQAFLIGTVLIRWMEMLRLWGPATELRHVIAIEEAHRLLRRSEGTGGHTVEMLANLLAEVRAYGQGLVIAEQIPTKIVPDVVKNSALKVMHRLPSQDDRDVVGATMNLDDVQSRAVVSLRPGEAAVHADGMDRPVRVRVDLGAPGRARPGPAAPATLRSAACAERCGDQPCGADELAIAARLGDDWYLPCWVDIVVIAHLAHRDLPSLAARLRAMVVLAMQQDRARLACGLTMLVERSVRSRWRDIAPSYPPSRLVTEVVAASTAYVSRGRWSSTRAAPEWCVGRWTWIDLEEALLAADPDVPHPETSAWQAAHPRLQLPSAPARAQLAHLRLRQSRRPGTDALVFGRPAALAIPEFSNDPVSALDELGVEVAWPYERLVGA